MPDPLGDISFTWYYIFIFLIGYFIGSIPFGVIITRLSGYGDITKIGSGNIGATNVLRTGNKKIAFLTLILDICKGLIPTIIILKILNQDLAIVISTGLVIGHILPILLFKKIKENILINIYIILISFLSINIILFGRGFISLFGVIIILINLFYAWGGKAVATGFGVLLALNPLIAIFCILIWLVVIFATRYSSLSAIVAFSCAPVIAYILSEQFVEEFYTTDRQLIEFFLFLAIIIWIRHTKNIKNLLYSKEPKIGKN